MAKCVIVFEDGRYSNFHPLTHLRPVYFLRPGIRALFEKIIDNFKGYTVHLFCRPEIAAITSEKTGFPVNRFEDIGFEEVVFVNGAFRYSRDFMEALKAAGKDAVLTSGGDIAAFKKVGKLSDKEYGFLKEGDLGAFLESLKAGAESLEVEIPSYGYLWDMVHAIAGEIADDFEYFRKQSDTGGFLVSKEEMHKQGRAYPGVEFIGIENIYVAPDAQLYPGVVVDASSGPVFIGSKVKVEPYSYLAGPLYVARETHVVGGKIAGCSVGPICRVGGELEETIIQGYSNKYHAGFIGHSYLGEWINLGAMTTNSDLKNNYAVVKSSVNGELIDTGQLKVGSFIGDFTRTAIGTLLNTGINIGVSCNIISDKLVTDAEIPSFTWYSPKHKMPYSYAKAVATIERSMLRREVKPSEALKKRLEEIFQGRPEH
jgi:UDP-N-acetylglucosamine diphosphorylase/glucosamine-1-phosphate N-acetyltransferase